MKIFSQILSTLVCLYLSIDFTSFKSVDFTLTQKYREQVIGVDPKESPFPFIHYRNIYFATSPNTEYPIFFSLENGEAYTTDDLSIEQGICIDLAFAFTEQAFVSPDLSNFSFHIPCARKTKIMRLENLDLWYEKEWKSLKDIVIKGDIAYLDLEKSPVLYAFETEYGKRGLLLFKERGQGYVSVDLGWDAF